ncbi:hypothetical protein DSECCO2_623820 [anaerobic digester metagenome]
MGDAELIVLDSHDRERTVHHAENLKVGLGIIDTYNIKVTLGELPVSSFLGVFAAPHLVDVKPLEGQCKFTLVLSQETGKRYGKVETKGDISLPVILEMENLLVRLTTAFAEQHFGIFEHRSIDGNKTIGGEMGFQLADDCFFGDFHGRQEVSETFQNPWFNDASFRCFITH